MRLEFTFPDGTETQTQPLIVAGNPAAADLIGLRMIDRDHFRLVYESWGIGLEESGDLAVPLTRDASLRVRMGELYRANGGPAGAVLGDSIVVWLERRPGLVAAQPGRHRRKSAAGTRRKRDRLIRDGAFL